MKRIVLLLCLAFLHSTNLIADEFVAKRATYEKDGEKIELKDISGIPVFHADFYPKAGQRIGRLDGVGIYGHCWSATKEEGRYYALCLFSSKWDTKLSQYSKPVTCALSVRCCKE